MSIEDEIRQQKEHIINTEEKQRQEELLKEKFEQELKEYGFYRTVRGAYWDINLRPPILVTPPEEIKAIIEEAKPHIIFRTPLIVRKFSDGTTRCRPLVQRDEQPDQYAFYFKIIIYPNMIDPNMIDTSDFYILEFYILENGLIATFVEGSSSRFDDTCYYPDDASYLLKKYDPAQYAASFRAGLISGIAQEAAQEELAEKERERAALQPKPEPSPPVPEPKPEPQPEPKKRGFLSRFFDLF